MDFYEAVNARRTIRDFQDEPMPRDALERILDAGMKAPTNDHMRDWHFVVVTDRAVAARCVERIPVTFSDEEIAGILRDWNLTDACQQQAYRVAIPRQHRMLLDASCLIVPLLRQKTNILHPSCLSDLNGFASIWCCIENIFLAATAEGYACTLRIPLGDEAEWTREALGFPKEYFMPCFLAAGKPREDAARAEQKAIRLADRIHLNRW